MILHFVSLQLRDLRKDNSRLETDLEDKDKVTLATFYFSTEVGHAPFMSSMLVSFAAGSSRNASPNFAAVIWVVTQRFEEDYNTGQI